MAAQTWKINLHPIYSVFFDIRQMLNLCKYVIDETISSPDEIVCLVVHQKTARATGYHVTPIRLFLKAFQSFTNNQPQVNLQTSRYIFLKMTDENMFDRFS